LRFRDPVARVRPDGKQTMRYLNLGLVVLFVLVIPYLAYRFGQDSRDGIETDEFQRRRSRGA
jgi:uncharacterized membrane protein YukC